MSRTMEMMRCTGGGDGDTAVYSRVVTVSALTFTYFHLLPV